MAHHSTLPTLEWVKRVNNSWIVHGGLNHQANAWLDYLEKLNDGRLLPSCEAARAVCAMRDPLQDPKPWFYAGLFSLATAEEARRFLTPHRVTKAVVPAMADDEDVMLWRDRVGPETRDLVAQLSKSIAQRAGSSSKPNSNQEK